MSPSVPSSDCPLPYLHSLILFHFLFLCLSLFLNLYPSSFCLFLTLPFSFFLFFSFYHLYFFLTLLSENLTSLLSLFFYALKLYVLRSELLSYTPFILPWSRLPHLHTLALFFHASKFSLLLTLSSFAYTSTL